MKVIAIESNSIAESLGIRPGDKIMEINGQSLADIIDYKYLICEEELRLKLWRRGKLLKCSVKKAEDEDLGIEFEPMAIRRCNNRCIFCFIDQLPPKMRSTLYIKDGDYRLSFLHGAYVTLTNISDEDMKRIVRQRLSPLYISVHSTEPGLRSRMLSNPLAGNILEKIAFLTEGRIQMHCQVVLCPGINDGEHLQKTIADLSRFFPQVVSISVVPVGLTKYRENLPLLMPVDSRIAKRLITEIPHWQERFRKRLGTRLVYLSDEFYLTAGLPVPRADYYEEFPQIENGVGLTRMFLDDFSVVLSRLPQRVSDPQRFILVTGVLASGFIRGITRQLNQTGCLTAELVVVKNRFFGEGVTVSGLLTGRDILCSLKSRDLAGATVLLPPNCVNTDGVFLDDISPLQMEEKLGVRVKVASCDLAKAILSEQ
jgi:putative radical SAM enzyme (TIGR03279 family)